MFGMSWPSIHLCPVYGDLSGRFFQSDLSRLDCPTCPVQTYCAGFPVLYVLSRLFCLGNPAAVVRFCPSRPVIAVKYWPSCPLCPVQAGLSGRYVLSDLPQLPCPRSLSQMSCHGCPIMIALSLLSCSELPVLSFPS
jgi:hypothetical protein